MRLSTSVSSGRIFLFSLALSCLIGLAFRLFFNPDRIRGWAEEALAQQGAQVAIKFRGAELKLSRGWMPIFAVEMTGVEISPSRNCVLDPGLKIQRIWLPLNITSLIDGKLALGTVAAEDVVIDTDAAKAHCPGATASTSPAGGREPASAPPTPAAKVANGSVVPWWTAKQLADMGLED